jgi:biotin synthase
LAHYLLTNKKTQFRKMEFDKDQNLKNYGITKDALLEIIRNGEPFQTSGCPGCNRPYYNERPGGHLYNYPRKLYVKEIEEIVRIWDS